MIREESRDRLYSDLFQFSVLKLAIFPVVLKEDLLVTIKLLFGNLADILEKIRKWIGKVRFGPCPTLQ